ncbi:PREDICTED: ribonuclease P protein subunit rpr2 [Bactrocera latifrons]|uniref:ribonuclease P protein subunit rpr2 n=1 Tax=Bactrocera latifrons TaxID=174628 RepID=UPI0008DD8CD0|nr:PREDICTED: ribonuclease P protein subunit rpr2 [Bactrocera latifrons]
MLSKKQQPAFQGKECFSRMNFLFQASMLMAGKNNALSAYYGELCRSIAKKAVLKIDPNIKRQLCKRCSLALKPGITADLHAETRRKRRKSLKNSDNVDENTSMILTCHQCGFRRQFIVNPNYNFWLDNEESVVESITLGNKEPGSKQKHSPVSDKETKETATK